MIASTFIPHNYLNYREACRRHSTSLPLTLGWPRDARQRPGADRGRYQRLTFEWAVRRRALPAEQRAVPGILGPAVARMSVGVNAELGGKGLGGKPFPVFKNFYGGGLGTVRGFEQGSLGVVDPTGAYIGGAKRINVNTELYPGARHRQRQEPACVRICRRRQRVARRREDHHRVDPFFGRPGLVVDLAGRPLEAELGPPIRVLAQR